MAKTKSPEFRRAEAIAKGFEFVRVKDYATGIHWYWEPSAALKRANWEPKALGADMKAAIDEAIKLNDQVEAWRSGGAKPEQIRALVKRSTIAALIERYDREYLVHQSENHHRAAKGNLAQVKLLFGDLLTSELTVNHVHNWRDRMMGTGQWTEAGPICAHHTAHNRLRALRAMFNWAMKPAQKLATSNPAEEFELATPAGRHQIWSDDDIGAFAAAAIAMDPPMPNMAFAVRLAAYTGQREGDLVGFTENHWKELHVSNPIIAARLAGKDKKIMGWQDIQNKSITRDRTRRQNLPSHIAIPFDPGMRDQVERIFAFNRAKDRPAGRLITYALVNDRSGEPWRLRHFIRSWQDILEEAAKKTGRAHMRDLQWRDLRRTCIVQLNRLGLNDQQIAAISGHKLKTIKTILEIYCPRDTVMAGAAILARVDHQAALAAHEKKGRRSKAHG